MGMLVSSTPRDEIHCSGRHRDIKEQSNHLIESLSFGGSLRGDRINLSKPSNSKLKIEPSSVCLSSGLNERIEMRFMASFNIIDEIL